MPFYEYECSSCGHHHEAMQKISDAPLKKCPACGRSTLKRLMSAPAFRLKGGGWYETDFKSDNDRKRNLAGEKDDAPKADATDKADKSDKSEKADKPAAKAEEAKPAARTTVPVKRPAAAKPRAPARKAASRKPVAKARSGRR